MPDPQCDRFTNPQEADLIYSCMDLDEAPLYGCDVHCRVCTASAGLDPTAGSWEVSPRWIRPSAKKESRNANGIFEYIASGNFEQNVILIPVHAGNYELAGCWENTGIEHFLLSICACFAGNNRCKGIQFPSRTPLNAASSTEGSDKLCTCWIFENGWRWPPDMNCIGRYTPNGAIRVRIHSTFLWNSGLLNLGANGEGHAFGSNKCTPNAAVACYGRLEAGSCNPGFNTARFYNSAYRDFEALRVNSITAAFAGSSPEIRMKNLLMAFIEADRAGPDKLKFQQMDSARRLHDEFINDNPTLPQFGRSYNLAGGDQTVQVPFSHFKRFAPFGLDAQHPFGTPYEYDVDADVDVTIPQTAISDVTLNITALGTFGAFGFEHVTLKINGYDVGTQVFFGVDSQCQAASQTVTIAQQTWNNTVMQDAAGDPLTTIHVEVQPVGINSDGCGATETKFEMTIAYTGQSTNEGPLAFENLLPIEALTGRMRMSGLKVNAEWVLVDAALQASIHLHRVRRNPPFGAQTLPDVAHQLVKLRLRCHMGVRISAADVAAFNDAAHTLEGSPLTLESNYGPDDNFPTLAGDVDEIEWYDSEGNFVRPPSRVVWMGHEGWTTDPQSRSVGSTCALHHALVGQSIRAVASHRAGNPGERHLVWTGEIDFQYLN